MALAVTVTVLVPVDLTVAVGLMFWCYYPHRSRDLVVSRMQVFSVANVESVFFSCQLVPGTPSLKSISRRFDAHYSSATPKKLKCVKSCLSAWLGLFDDALICTRCEKPSQVLLREEPTVLLPTVMSCLQAVL